MVRRVDLSVCAEVFKYDPPAWHQLGACRGRPTEWWFSDDLGETIAAKTLCKRVCAYRWECLGENLYLEYGIFGGFDPVERARIRTTTAVAIVNPALLQLVLKHGEAI